MNESLEYVEWHLTAQGWVRGTESTAFGGMLHLEAPRDRVLTYRWIGEQANQLDRLEEQWRCGDSRAVERLLARYGDVRRLANAR